MNDTAQQRRLEAAISEVTGNDMPDDLPDRILSQLATRRPRRAATTWFAAAALLLGVGVVLAVDGCRDEKHTSSEIGSQNAQDPKAKPPAERRIEITAAELHEEGVIPVAAGDAVDRLLSIARDTRTNLVIAGSITGHSKVTVGGIPPRIAIERIAAELKTTITEFDNVLVIGRGPTSLPRDGRVSLECVNVPVREFLKQVHAQTGVAIVAAADLRGSIDCNVLEVHWHSLLSAVTNKLGLQIIGCGGVLAIRAGKPRPTQRVALMMRKQTVMKVCSSLSTIQGMNIIISPIVQNTVSVVADATCASSLLTAIAATDTADHVIVDGLHHMQPSRLTHDTTTLTAEYTTPSELIDVTHANSPDCKVTSSVKQQVSVFVRRARTDDVLRAAAHATGHELKRVGDAYIIE